MENGQDGGGGLELHLQHMTLLVLHSMMVRVEDTTMWWQKIDTVIPSSPVCWRSLRTERTHYGDATTSAIDANCSCRLESD
ncbi:hypothetical protein ZHAS_00019132 [Anopheles sinensis]|uniref:Uncharacterized protein n=1 Tax=Anopheles sinensis TaxID=74873 RepID=A0A084WLI3_ANOSI|nr:hypothetical protein ZHAS_00019132 [Anopheles sinensis]